MNEEFYSGWKRNVGQVIDEAEDLSSTESNWFERTASK